MIEGALMDNEMKKKVFKRCCIAVAFCFVMYCFWSYWAYLRPPTCPDQNRIDARAHIMILKPVSIWHEIFNVPAVQECVNR